MAKIKLSSVLRQMNAASVKRLLPKRPRYAHKGDFGKLLLICGSQGFTGAAELAAKAAARMGAGLVFVGVPASVYPIVASKLTEPMVFPLPDQDGQLSPEAVPEILRHLKDKDACLIGCGLGRGEGSFAAVRAVLENSRCPVVLDADGINVLQGHIDILRGTACPVILTPHEGEFLRLGGDLGRSRFQGAMQLHCQTDATVLLKGHRTLICGKDGCYLNRCGNPGMAKGGSGDVLAGMITALLGFGLKPTEAAALGAWLHGAAGDLCAQELGEYGILPSDLIDCLPRLLK